MTFKQRRAAEKARKQAKFPCCAECGSPVRPAMRGTWATYTPNTPANGEAISYMLCKDCNKGEFTKPRLWRIEERLAANPEKYRAAMPVEVVRRMH